MELWWDYTSPVTDAGHGDVGPRWQQGRAGHSRQQQQTWAHHDCHSPQPAAMGWSQTAPEQRHCLHRWLHCWYKQIQDSGHSKRPLGRVWSRLVPIITILCLPVPLFSLPLCLCLGPPEFILEFKDDQVCQIWRVGMSNITRLYLYPHKMSGCLYPCKHQVK